MGKNGFILMVVLFLLLLLAVTALTLNWRGGMQAKMAANQVQAVQSTYGQMAAIQEALWQLTKDPCWWTSAASKDLVYEGVTYGRTVAASAVANYTDTLTLAVTAPGGQQAMTASFRYFIHPPIAVATVDQPISQVARDAGNALYFSVPNKHRIYRRDTTGEITVAAGTGTSGYSGDGGPALSAQLDTPHGVFVDTATGDLYIADTRNHCIRKVTGGAIATAAGICGQSGSSGDGGPATAAKLNEPRGVFLDATGLYIADTNNHKVRKVAAGMISTVAGTGTGGFSGDGGPATAAKLNHPNSVAVSASTGHLYIADTDNHCIRRVASGTGTMSTSAGSGTNPGDSGEGGAPTAARLDHPRFVTIISGDMYIADTDNHKIKLASGTTLSRVAGNAAGTAGYGGDGGHAVDASLDAPAGLCLDSAGNILIADTNNMVIRVVDQASGGIASYFTSAGFALSHPADVTVKANGDLYVADTDNHRIRKLDILGQVTTFAGTGSSGYTGDGGDAISARLNGPRGIVFGSAGDLYIADRGNNVIRKVSSTTGNISTVAGTGTAGYSGDLWFATLARLRTPGGVAMDTAGNLYIADTGNHCIRKVIAGFGIIVTIAGTGTAGYTGDGGAAISARLDSPEKVSLDAAGNLYIADTGNNCIRNVTAATGLIGTVAGTGTAGYTGDGGAATSARLNSPMEAYVDAAGNLFIADRDNHRIRVVSAQDHKIRTLAGTGQNGFNGDDQPAVWAKLNAPQGVAMAAVRGGMKIYIADRDNNRIRKLTLERVREVY